MPNRDGAVTVAGFTSADLLVFDVTSPAHPALVNGLTVTGAASPYRVSFEALAAHRYVALALSAVGLPEVEAVGASPLADRGNRADWLVIAPPAFVEAATVLAAHRAEQGLETRVVNVADVYDRFGFGEASPAAIRAFLRYAHLAWERPPRYVVMAGNGTFDYRDVLARGDNFIPMELVQTAFGLAVSDAFYADVLDDDGRPELAVGRLPALSAADLAAIVGKLVAFESALATEWARDLVLLADQPDDGGNFPQDSDDIGALLTAPWTIDRIYADELGYDLAKTSLREAFTEGARVISYLGHGGFDRLSRAGLLTSAQVPDMTNAERLPILFAGTCVAGEAGQPGRDCLAETLIRHPGGGCVAVWAPSTLAHNAQSRVLGARFLTALFQQENPRLGDAMLAAVQGLLQTEPDAVLARQAAAAYNLLGDPATMPGLGRR